LYYLTSNLAASATDKDAITVEADDVTLDLMGFCLTGPGKGSGSGNSGIFVATSRTNVEIRNGSIKAFGHAGINSTCTGIRAVGLRVRDTGATGIFLGGWDGLVMDCTVMLTGGDGILIGNSSLVKGSQVAGNSHYGIYLKSGSTAVGNTARNNINGIHASGSASVTDNTVSGNSANGIYCEDRCTITRNTAYNNAGAGIAAGNDCTITNNTTDGLTSGANCTLADNTVTP
jgi:parallel beta-helix repeat protein